MEPWGVPRNTTEFLAALNDVYSESRVYVECFFRIDIILSGGLIRVSVFLGQLSQTLFPSLRRLGIISNLGLLLGPVFF